MTKGRSVTFDEIVLSTEILERWGEILEGEKKILPAKKRSHHKKKPKHEFERSARIDKKGNLTVEIRLKGDHAVIAYFIVKAGEWKYWLPPRP